MQKTNLNNKILFNKLEKILNLIAKKPKTFESVFIELFEKDFQSQLNFISEMESGRLKGLIISVKDLFNVKGFKTRGGTTFLDPKPSKEDAECISLIREAGGLLLGHTNMTELAYSGLGINPHYGTPENPIFPDSIPGGSTSGGAVTVALDISDITIGTDTGGSTRIPAAFTGITGLKPTQDSISRDGSLILSSSLDSIGLMAKNVELCKLGYEVMRNKKNLSHMVSNNKNMNLIIPLNFGFENIEPEVKFAFDSAKLKLIENGYNVIDMNIPILDIYKKVPLWQFAAVECQTEYFDSYRKKPKLIDPNILKRIDRANEVMAVEYNLLLKIRNKMILEFNNFLNDSFLLLPTVVIHPPLLKDCKDKEFYDRVNLISLQNTSLANYMNGCSLSIPYTINKKPIGIMLNGTTDNDDQLLEVGSKIEEILGL
ncbi:amidase family protein [Alphaproteobacteria bacterium]|nr:amidase family protein [Alphaproteobacteria bacterium]